jgi:hypothetical protein
MNNVMGTAAPTATVPNVVGETQAQATTDITGVGFVVSVATAYSSTVATGLVIEQSPVGGTTANVGSTVSITVSLGDRGGGLSKRRRHQRYYVEIDGQHFAVSSAAEATQLLQQARALAERQAEQKAERVVRKLSKKREVPHVRLTVPAITVSPELREEALPLIDDINRLYAQAAMNAELRLRMAEIAKREADEEEEEDLLLLL